MLIRLYWILFYRWEYSAVCSAESVRSRHTHTHLHAQLSRADSSSDRISSKIYAPVPGSFSPVRQRHCERDSVATSPPRLAIFPEKTIDAITSTDDTLRKTLNWLMPEAIEPIVKL